MESPPFLCKRSVLKNGTPECAESSHVASYAEGIAYVDGFILQIKARRRGGQAIVMAKKTVLMES